jgi:hypothetical protein
VTATKRNGKRPGRKRSGLTAYDDDYLLCRNPGHVWRVLGYYRAPDGLVCRDLVCDRCEAERVDRWTRDTYARLGTRYKYPAGYLIPADDDGQRTDTTDIRRETIRRADVYANEQALLDTITKGRT